MTFCFLCIFTFNHRIEVIVARLGLTRRPRTPLRQITWLGARYTASGNTDISV